VTAQRTASVFAGFRFPREVISLAVRWYLRYGLSYREVEELLAERGVTVDHVSIYRWVQRFTPEFIEAAKLCRHVPGDRWFVDETYLKVAGIWTYLYRAVDQYGQVIDVLLSGRRDLAAARCFFARALRAGTVPVEVSTDRAPVYPRVLDELVPSALHIVKQYANNPVLRDARDEHEGVTRDEHVELDFPGRRIGGSWSCCRQDVHAVGGHVECRGDGHRE
jgi:transposase-like protein